MKSGQNTSLMELQWGQCRRAVMVGVMLILVAADTWPNIALTKAPRPTPAQPKADIAKNTRVGTLMTALLDALNSVEELEEQVAAGSVIAEFGEKAQQMVEEASIAAGVAAPQLTALLDGVLHRLFLQQIRSIQRQLYDKFKHSSRRGLPAVLARADELFVAGASKLIRPGSGWSFEEERVALRVALEVELQQASQVAQERQRAALTQQATADVIGKLQKQMEQLGEKLRGTGAGSPWALWTSYHVPGTPFQMSGRYQQGRANIELNLSPNKDPANAEAGFVEGLTPQNLGLSFNIGV